MANGYNSTDSISISFGNSVSSVIRGIEDDAQYRAIEKSDMRQQAKSNDIILILVNTSESGDIVSLWQKILHDLGLCEENLSSTESLNDDTDEANAYPGYPGAKLNKITKSQFKFNLVEDEVGELIDLLMSYA